ncbi:hypothetical protein [Cystobacter fuscus]|uniref:hypothetical protein n=1 Tax=Cystobacter fuscus TaxID=43 RepID=UPI002B2DAD45|nr:hypothetical protein F0U63_46635 [Cystobacter fuscus]
MNQVQRETLARMANIFVLQELRPTHLEAEFVQPPSENGVEITPEMDVVVQLSRNPSSAQSEFAAIFRFDVKLRTKGDPPVIAARMRYHAIAMYSIVQGSEFSDDDLQLFAQTNGMIHVWPYLRTFVQNSCAQLGAPVVTLPPFRIGQTLAQPWQQVKAPEAPANT